MSGVAQVNTILKAKDADNLGQEEMNIIIFIKHDNALIIMCYTYYNYTNTLYNI